MEPLMNLAAVEEIHEIFAKINSCKAKIDKAETLESKYADAVNELMSVDIDDSQYGEEISKKALELGKELGEAWQAVKDLVSLEETLASQYGLLRGQAA